MTLADEVSTRIRYLHMFADFTKPKEQAAYETRMAAHFLNTARNLRDKRERSFFVRLARIHHRCARYFLNRQSSY